MHVSTGARGFAFVFVAVGTVANCAGAGSSAQGPTCPLILPPDTQANARAACTFGTGARVADTLGITADVAKQIPIKNIVVLMKENRSFDHMLGQIHDLQPGVEAVPASFANPDTSGAQVTPFHAKTTCIPFDPNHQWDAMHACVDNGAMDGFVKNAAASTSSDGHFVMSFYQQDDLPFYYWLASTFAVNDRHFASVRSGTNPNRLFLYLATNDGVKEANLTFPNPATPSIFDRLDQAGVRWGVYSDDLPLEGVFLWTPAHKGVAKVSDFLSGLDDGTLPSVSFVDGRQFIEDEHPIADVQIGERWTRNIYEHARTSPLWPGLAMVWTYDESGAFADHVPPPNTSCVARPDHPEDALYVELGVRVPLAVISPWAKPHFVSHVVEEHTAITRFIETVFDLPALTARDANSPALLDLFDFSSCTAPFAQAPESARGGSNGCLPALPSIPKLPL